MNILITIFWWMLGLLGIIVIGYVVFLFIYYQAIEAAQKALAEERLKLDGERAIFDEEKASLDKRELGFRKQTGEVMDNYFKKRDELKLQIKNVAEESISVQKIKEEAQLKVDHIMRENMRLRNDLTAARQRAKRLANKAKNKV